MMFSATTTQLLASGVEAQLLGQAVKQARPAKMASNAVGSTPSQNVFLGELLHTRIRPCIPNARKCSSSPALARRSRV